MGTFFTNDVYGIDINSEAVNIAKKHGIKAKLGDIEEKWDYPNEYFDIVIASHIVEHVVNPDALLLEANRVLKKKGILIIATPNLGAWFNRVLLLIGYQPFFTEVSTVDKTMGLGFTRKLTPLRSPLGHLRLFTLKALQDILLLHEFRINKTFGAEFLAFPPLILKLDKLLSYVPSLASNIVIIAQKKKL